MAIWTGYWPDPDLSRGLELTPLAASPKVTRSFVQTIRCWTALQAGPAYQIFVTQFKPQLNIYLENDPDLMLGPRARYTCCMVGRSEYKIYPAIILHSPDESFCRKVDKIIRSSDEWKIFKKSNPLFVLITAARAPSRISPGTSPHDGDEAGDDQVTVISHEPAHRLFGTSISFQKSGPSPSPMGGNATLGGIVFLDGVPYGLTVAHALNSSQQHDRPQSSLNLGFPCVEMYGFGDEDDSLFAALAQDEPTEPDTIETDTEGLSGPVQGTVRPEMSRSSQGALQQSSDDGKDWALIKLSPAQAVQARTRNLNYLPGLVLQNGEPLVVSRMGVVSSQEQRVLLVTASKGAMQGTVSSTPSFYRSDGQRRFGEVLSVRLDRGLVFGDSGSWVIDAAEGFWLGHIIAEEPSETVAYLVPAHIIAQDIELKVDARFSIAGPAVGDGASVSASATTSSDNALVSQSSPTDGPESLNILDAELGAVSLVSETKQPSEQDDYDVRPDDIVIAVVGVTGSGKSTFISQFSETSVIIGHGLDSCTNTVSIYKCHSPSIRRFFMIDTPGFDDTYKSDSDVLSDIAIWLRDAYQRNFLLTGIIYLHRIIDVRFGGASMLNQRLWRRICGKDALPHVVLATTFWDQIDEVLGAERESELANKEDIWGSWIEKGSVLFRQRDRDSAEQIINMFARKRSGGQGTMILTLQKELVDEGKSLDRTSAGAELQVRLEAVQKRYEAELASVREELMEALEAHDRELEAQLEKERRALEQRLDRERVARQKLKADTRG
ncbi:hypothetical protein PV08_11564 [Exophiala spinifera]|uniref:G domain-containing protein n=1 Tax=Exophiala spinifera TaxID=91928 RepID=A0A0D2AVY1_9EURO|nr:uncharacterized protein PV08_11564 [Exophiala spinifera]KIW10600.1 hypothetical protein PV08_11564 [Exophiala spinifera]